MAEAILFAISASQNAIGHLPLREHSYVCATFDFWPETKCDYGMRDLSYVKMSEIYVKRLKQNENLKLWVITYGSNIMTLNF